ncbi:hypothetical protein, partial [Stenotrophomonas maltophilia]|uniref:hypothetical protein n=1 Tax=Stenotrophomonas maltophilia TaxID=40324 RepID=UPI0013043E39
TALVDDDVGWAEDTAGEVEAVKQPDLCGGGIGNGDIALQRPATALVDDDVGWAEDTAGEVEAVKQPDLCGGGIGN